MSDLQQIGGTACALAITMAGVLTACLPQLAHADAPLLILDTDLRTDVDDVGTLAMIHGLQDRGRVNLIGVIATTRGEHIVGAIDAINTFYGRADIPIGVIREGRDTGGMDDFAPALADTTRFPSRQTTATAPEATLLYRRLLHEAPDKSVRILVVGGQNGIHDLMQSTRTFGDGIDLSGLELIERKVSELVIMGGRFDDDTAYSESNIRRGEEAANAVASHWPTRIVYCGWEVGAGVLTGETLTDPETNPVAKGYEVFRHSGPVGTIGNRDSWDQVTALYAITGLTYDGQDVFTLSEPHEIRFVNNGQTVKTPSATANRHFLKQTISKAGLTAIISDLMTTRQKPAQPAG